MIRSGSCKLSSKTDTVVLVVEDEPLLLFDVADSLEDAGFTVHTATNAEQALVALERCDDISVVFTDINMPGTMDGIDLAERISKVWPHIGVILTSGHLAIRFDDEEKSAMRFFPKPYVNEHVVAEIERIASSA